MTFDCDVTRLKLSTENDEIESSLSSILQHVKNTELFSDPETGFKELLKSDFINLLSELLNKHSDSSLVYLLLQILAELAKAETGRSLCSCSNIIKSVLLYIPLQSIDGPTTLSFQACRVLGNICFEYENARNIVKENKGEEILLNLLRDLCAESRSSTDTKDHLKIACGSFINLIDDHESLQLSVLSLGILEVISKIIRSFPQCNDLMLIVMNIFDYFLDLNKEEVIKFLASDESLESVYVLLQTTSDEEIIESLFQNLSSIAENDNAKTAISSTSFPNNLCNLVEMRIEGPPKLVELASDFIILLLLGDESMHLLYKNGKGEVFLKMRSWLNCSQPMKLQTTSAFALCNMARSDENCIQLLECGLMDDIISHLKHYPVDAKQPILQHALIGTLANLAIATQNKATMVEKGIVDVCLGYLETESFTVLFKLLGTIRMLLDKNDKVACRLGNNKNFLSKLDQSAVVKEHEGIRCESLRIFASITKNCYNHEVMKTLEEYNVVRNLLSLLQSEHMKMKNEAILSLVIITSTLGGDVLKNHTSETCDMLKVLLTSPLPDEFSMNCLNFIKASHQSLAVRSAFKEQGVYEAVKKYETQSNERIKELVETIKREMLF